eukprot:683350-Pelagomonas_calceolata.AAC.2
MIVSGAAGMCGIVMNTFKNSKGKEQEGLKDPSSGYSQLGEQNSPLGRRSTESQEEEVPGLES